MRTRGPLTRDQVFWLVLVSATVLKLALALSTIGTNDVLYFEAYAKKIKTEPAVALYRDGVVIPDATGHPRLNEIFAHPPFIIYLLRFLNWSTAGTGLSFPFLFRLFSILADVGSAILLRDLLRRVRAPGGNDVAAYLFAGAPLLIFLSGFHGNTDPVMLFFLILAVWLLSAKEIPWMAGMAFGMSCNIKVWPLILVPVFVLYASGFRRRLWFSAAALGTFLVASMPYALQAPELLIAHVLGYGSHFGHWGVPRILGITGPAALLSLYQQYGKHLVMLAAIAAAIWMHYRSKASLLVRVGVIASLFLALTPAFGIQYLSWLLPWVTVLGVEVTLIYLICTGVFMFHVYTFWCNGLPWYLGDSTITGWWSGFLIWHEIICWMAVLLCLFLFARAAGLLKIRPRKPRTATGQPARLEMERKRRKGRKREVHAGARAS